MIESVKAVSHPKKQLNKRILYIERINRPAGSELLHKSGLFFYVVLFIK